MLVISLDAKSTWFCFLFLHFHVHEAMVAERERPVTDVTVSLLPSNGLNFDKSTISFASLHFPLCLYLIFSVYLRYFSLSVTFKRLKITCCHEKKSSEL